MSDTPQDKLAANSQASKGMGEGANHPFEATGREWWEAQNHIREQAPQAPSLYLNEPPGIQANREQMGYTNLKEGLAGYYEWQNNKLVEVSQANREQMGYSTPDAKQLPEAGGRLDE